jgi:simple sugar transport system permease protein
LNTSATTLILAVGLLVVLISGGIDISFAVAASVVQYVTALALDAIGGGGWISGLVIAGATGIGLGAINAAVIHYFRIISIVVTIATFNIFFGLLMFLTHGVSIYNLPAWWTHRTVLFEYQQANGTWAELTLPVLIMAICALATWLLIRHTSTGRQLYAFGDNAEGARRLGINIAAMHFIAYGWLGLMAGIGGLVQVHYAQEVVPNALIGRELDVLAAVVLGGARLGGGRGTVLGCILGVLLVSVTQNGLNLLGISPYAFKMVIGCIILIAITLSNAPLGQMLADFRQRVRQ